MLVSKSSEKLKKFNKISKEKLYFKKNFLVFCEVPLKVKRKKSRVIKEN